MTMNSSRRNLVRRRSRADGREEVRASVAVLRGVRSHDLWPMNPMESTVDVF